MSTADGAGRSVTRARARLGRRVSASALALRAVIGVLGAALLVLPVLQQAGPATLVLLVCALPLLAAVRAPDGPWLTVVMIGSLFGWVVGSVLSGSPGVVAVCAYALLLFWLHRVASLAAVLPLDVELDRPALLRFLARTALVSVVAVPLMVVLQLLHSRTHGSVLLALLGALAAVGVLVVLAAVLLRRSTD